MNIFKIQEFRFSQYITGLERSMSTLFVSCCVYISVPVHIMFSFYIFLTNLTARKTYPHVSCVWPMRELQLHLEMRFRKNSIFFVCNIRQFRKKLVGLLTDNSKIYARPWNIKKVPWDPCNSIAHAVAGGQGLVNQLTSVT